MRSSAHPLAGHGDQLRAVENAQINSQLGGTFAKEIRERDLSQLAHGASIRLVENQARVLTGFRDFDGGEQLQNV
jgi:hypothetical protein